MKLRALFLVLLLPVNALAKQVTFGSKEVAIVVRYEVTDQRAGPNPTYLRFPRAISRVDNATLFAIKAASPQGQEPDFRELEVRPRYSQGSQKIEVLLSDGTVVRIRATISDKEGVASSYDFEPNRTVEQTSESGNAKAPIQELEVMRQVLQGETPAGMRRKTFDQGIWCKPSGLSGRIKSGLESDAFKVFQIELRNESSKGEFRIHEENFIFKGRDLARSPLIHVSSRTLSPRRKGIDKATITVLTDPSVTTSRLSICDIADQIEVLNQKTVKK
ncbi:MAG: hypothetical protein AB7G93_13355 [Bdellovibrionales bacterium]